MLVTPVNFTASLRVYIYPSSGSFVIPQLERKPSKPLIDLVLPKLSSMADDPLLQQIADMRKRLFEEKLVNDQFAQLEDLEDADESPHFVEEVYDLFFRDSAKFINLVEQEIAKDPADRVMLEKVLHQLKGSSSSVGANLVTIATNRLRAILPDGTLENCRLGFEEIKVQHQLLRVNLDPYFELKRQVQPEERADNDDGEHSEWDENDG